jgi:signal transduction histidine kinase
MSSARAHEANVTLERDMPTRDIEMLADAAKLEQVLLNLLNNAIEAMASATQQTNGDGGGSITLRARRHPRHVLLEVEDQGPGLPSADAPIFDPFFSTKPDGTGLGLAITHRIVSDHHGSITVESRPGRTVFRVSLPLEAQ